MAKTPSIKVGAPRVNPILGFNPLPGINLNRIVNASVSSVPTAVPTPNVNNVALFTNATPPNTTQSFFAYVSASAVAQDWGTNSNPAAFANILFGTTPNITNAGGVLYIIPMQDAVSATSSIFTTPNIVANITNFQAVSDGAFTINIDGTTFDSPLLDFTSINTVQDIANIIQSCLFNVALAVNSSNEVSFTSKKFGTTSIITLSSPTSGTDITGTNFLNIAGGTGGTAGVNSSGETLPEAITRTMTAVQYCAIATDVDLDDDALNAAGVFIQAQEGMFLQEVICSTGDISVLALPNAQANQRQNRFAIYTNYAQRVQAKAGFLTTIVGVDYTGNNTAKTAQAKTITGLTPDVIYDSLYTTLNTAGCDYYAQIGGTGFVVSTGGNDFSDNVINDIALEFSCQYAVFNYLRATNTKIPQTEAAMTGVKEAVIEVLQQFVDNGVLAPGKWNSSQIFGIPDLFYMDISTLGYYVYSQPIAQQLQSIRDQRIAPTIQIAGKRAGAEHTFSIPVLLEN